ncbi:MAG TPA: hydrogenase, partial [Kiloniellaceae bacterium]|nr:hydrogenase [Kiloniellaceae bacterium]
PARFVQQPGDDGQVEVVSNLRLGVQMTQKELMSAFERHQIRIIAATNRDLAREMEADRFRPDLYYRLNVFPIEVAPLRHRKDDIALLAALFLERACTRFHLPRARLTPDALSQLERYDWPGNVRKLQNITERAVITARGGPLRLALSADAQPVPRAESSEWSAEVLTEKEMQRRARANMMAALARCGGRVYGPDGAAALLGIKPTTLAARLKAAGLRDAKES